jgi:hypothetical protein
MMIEIKTATKIEPLATNEAVIALYQVENSNGWLLSGILYRSAESAIENLAAFNPAYVKCFILDLS